MKSIARVLAMACCLSVVHWAPAEAAPEATASRADELPQRVEDAPNPVGTATEPAPTESDNRSHARSAGRELRLVGGGLLAAGAVTTGVGLYMFKQQAEQLDAGNPPGNRKPFLVLAGGAAGLLIGGVLYKTGVDMRNDAKARYAAPVITGDSVGFAVGGTF